MPEDKWRDAAWKRVTGQSFGRASSAPASRHEDYTSMRIKNRTIIVLAVGSIVLGIIAKWWGWLLLSLFFVVAGIQLSLTEDYRPWRDSMFDLGVISLDTQAVVDSRELTDAGRNAGENKNACLGFVKLLEQQPIFGVEAQASFCRIKIRTTCPCSNEGYDHEGMWLGVHFTKGPGKGKDGWVCKSAVRPSVIFP